MTLDTENDQTLPSEGPAGSRWWLVGKYAISILFVAYLIINIEWLKVWASVSTVSVAWLLISLFYIPAGIVAVASRYLHLINALIPYRTMIRLVIYQAAISTFFANAAGSVGYIGILIKVNKVPADLAVQSTIIARLADLFSSLIVAAVLVAFAWNQLERIQPLVLLAILVSSIVLALAVMVVAVARRLKVPATSPAPGARGTGLWPRMLGFGIRVVRLEPGYVASILPKTLWYSLALQVVIAVAMYCSVRAFHLEVGFLEAALVGVVSSFIASIPITVFGGLGVYEASTIGMLTVFGVPIEAAAGMILVVRSIFFIVMAFAFFVIRSPNQ